MSNTGIPSLHIPLSWTTFIESAQLCVSDSTMGLQLSGNLVKWEQGNWDQIGLSQVTASISCCYLNKKEMHTAHRDLYPVIDNS